MNKSLKIAKWEFIKNMRNKSFLISLFLTPLIVLASIFISTMIASDNSSSDEPVAIYIGDQAGAFTEVQQAFRGDERFSVKQTNLDEQGMKQAAAKGERALYVSLPAGALDKRAANVYIAEEASESYPLAKPALESGLQKAALVSIGLTPAQKEAITAPVSLTSKVIVAQSDKASSKKGAGINDTVFSLDDAKPGSIDAMLERVIPGIFAGIILFSVVTSGMMIFQSASQEKKDKISETILSSVTATELMQGKIIGYFLLGLVQLAVWMLLIGPVALWKFGGQYASYLASPEAALLIFIALIGYFLFAAMFVALGATIEDASSTGNFQGLVMILPFVPFFFLGSLMLNPNSMLAHIGSFIPFTAPGFLIARLAVLKEWPWGEVLAAVAVMLAFTYLFMKLAGKVFRTAVLMYGKNATPREIWRWMWTK